MRSPSLRGRPLHGDLKPSPCLTLACLSLGFLLLLGLYLLIALLQYL